MLAKKTKCKIYIRGKGATRVRCTQGKNYQFDNEEEPLHVLLHADTEEALDHACSILEPILNGRLDDEENRLKRTELMQLASENRLALKYTEWCEICGEQGHKRYSCPNKPLALNWSFEAACSNCGEHSHKSEDCSSKKKKRTKTLEEKLAEFNKVTGANVLLNKRDVEIIAKKKQQPPVPQVEPEYYDEDDVRPPGVD
jgi:splicing factor 1